jgi:patatin-like phospholipase/acyl hydrolase
MDDRPSRDGTVTPFRVLSLDGGGAKGFYTLGVLKEIEAIVSQPLCNSFDLIFGTSTGSIIAALLGLGFSVDEIHALYRAYVPIVMEQWYPSSRSWALKNLANHIFGDIGFDLFQTRVGIVATRWLLEKPMIFKSDVSQAHGRRGTFVPGFGCTVADAVIASCSAYPFFKRPTIRTSAGHQIELMDGGYCANNPTLYAIADALIALQKSRTDVRVVSIGVGSYPERRHWRYWLTRLFFLARLLQKTLNVNTESMEQLRSVLFADVWTIRINDTFEQPEMATDLLESNLDKLNLLYQRGSESFARHETDLQQLMR